MRTPIVDFLDEFVGKSPTRLHMPGHKGRHGYERDVTEVSGADSLYHASGIIRDSEKNAGELFSADTFYSAEGSSLSIRAMLYLTSLYAKQTGKNNKILAARNVHTSFISAAALLDIEVEFFGYSEDYLSAQISPEELAVMLDGLDERPVAVYLTSPDYLGRMQDIRGISRVCHERGILTIVDNAHGAYLAFLEENLHPIALGADMCADSAHKTLPALTGAAYLHVSKTADSLLSENAKAALSLFGSTSPSYLILESLDRLNGIIDGGLRGELSRVVSLVSKAKLNLSDMGYTAISGEPMKITIDAREYGYSGQALGETLEKNNIYPEFYDNDYLVLMLSSESTEEDLGRLCAVLSDIPKKKPIVPQSITLAPPARATSIRDAMLSPRELVPVKGALGRVLADGAVACPPAVPILVSGEVVNKTSIEMFKRYGYDKIWVIK